MHQLVLNEALHTAMTVWQNLLWYVSIQFPSKSPFWQKS